MAIITRFGGSGGGTPIVDPYPHVWECTVVQSGTTGVVTGVVTLEAYDILHYTMPLGFSTYDLMIGGVTYHTSFRNEGEMYVQWDGTDFVVVSANAACALSHVWTNPTYTITGTVLEITTGVEDLHTNDVIVLTLASGESASNIEFNSQLYTIDLAISAGTNYVQFNGTSFDNALFNFKGDAVASDVASGKTFYSSSGILLTGTGGGSAPTYDLMESQTGNVPATGIPHDSARTYDVTFTNVDLTKCAITIKYIKEFAKLNSVAIVDSHTLRVGFNNSHPSTTINNWDFYVNAYEFDSAVSITRSFISGSQAPTYSLTDSVVFTTYSTYRDYYQNANYPTCVVTTPYDIVTDSIGSSSWNRSPRVYINIVEV